MATIISLTLSIISFAVYFSAVGMIVQEAGVSLTTYLASASVIGLALGFGSQGLVQDVVTGLTLIFSNVLAVGDMVKISNEIGKVEQVGMRFTIIVNFENQRIHIPNRSITQINRFRGGAVRVYLDLQIPDGIKPEPMTELIFPVIMGMYSQHPSIILSKPEFFNPMKAELGDWNYQRIKLRIWPGQGTLIETVLKERILAVIKEREPDYCEWMINITYRADHIDIK